MINVANLLENMKGLRNKAILEYNASQLISNPDGNRRELSNRMTGYYKYLDQTETDGQARTHWEVPSASTNDKYEVVVEIHVPTNGGLFAWAKSKKWQPKLFKDILTKSDVKVHCECEDFKYRMKYQASPKGKNAGLLAQNQQSKSGNGSSLTEPPVHTNPNGNLRICKHIHRVLSLFPTNASTIMSQAKKYKMTKDADVEKTEKADAGQEPNVETEKPVVTQAQDKPTLTEADKSIVTDSLYKAAEDMAVAPSTPTVTSAEETTDQEEEQSEETPEEDADVTDALDKAYQIGMLPQEPEVTEEEQKEETEEVTDQQNPEPTVTSSLYPKSSEKEEK